MTQQSPERDIDRRDVAKGAGAALLSRLGALVEIVSQPVFTWLFGLPAYGLYTVLWAAVNIVENIVDLAMTTALQRIIPQAGSEERAHAALKLALLVSVVPSIFVATLATLAAKPIAALVNVAPQDQAALVTGVALFAWALPLWTFIEVATSALRARRAFGPEIRLRIFYEQLLRLLFAVLFHLAGAGALGLLLAHLASLTVTALLSLRLLARYFDLRLAFHARVDRALAGDLLGTGMALLPATIGGRLFSDGPPLLLNFMLPGAAGAIAAGQYGIARKISSLPQMVRIAFSYVMAPLASAQAARDRTAVNQLYGFATRLSAILVIPISAALCFIADDLLQLFAPGASAALPLVLILTIARGLEAGMGPSSSVVETIGHRLLPFVNTLIGIAIWIGVALLLMPTYGAVAIALGVGIGIVVSSGLALVELQVADNLRPFGRSFWRAAAASAVATAPLLLVEVLAEPLGDLRQALLVVVTLAGALWLALRFGLRSDDRLALGSAGRKLHLHPAV